MTVRFCFNCGARLAEDDIFCPNCGVKNPPLGEEAPAAVEPLWCPRCRTQIETMTSYCLVCGTTGVKELPPEPVPEEPVPEEPAPEETPETAPAEETPAEKEILSDESAAAEAEDGTVVPGEDEKDEAQETTVLYEETAAGIPEKSAVPEPEAPVKAPEAPARVGTSGPASFFRRPSPSELER